MKRIAFVLVAAFGLGLALGCGSSSSSTTSQPVTPPGGTKDQKVPQTPAKPKAVE